MKLPASLPVCAVLLSGAAVSSAQSVADTLVDHDRKIVRLSNEIEALRARPVTGRAAAFAAPSDTFDFKKPTGLLMGRISSDEDGGSLGVFGRQFESWRLDSGKQGGFLQGFNSSGKRVFGAGASNVGTGGLWIYPPGEASHLVFLGASANNYGGALFLNNAKSKVTHQLAADSDGAGYIELYGRSEKKIWKVEESTGGNGRLTLFDKTGAKELISLTSTVDGQGRVTVNGTAVHDYAEVIEFSERRGITPGSVVSAAPDGSGLALASGPYDSAAVGVISGASIYQPGLVIGSRADGSNDLPVAVAGQVYVRVSAEGGHIRVGDLLVTSSTPGVAMRGLDPARLTGTVIGKALQPYSGGAESLIRMLVMNR